MAGPADDSAGGAGGAASSSSSAPGALTVRAGSGVAGDFLIEDGEHLVFKDPRWMRDALASAKRLLAKCKYGGSPEEFRRFALTLLQKRVALELYIKAHHEELRREVAASKSAAMTAATAKAVSESNAVADFARQITLSKKEAARWHALAESLGAELESLRRAGAAAAAAESAGASASAEREREAARLAGELAAKAAECAELREVYEAEVASAVAAGEAAVARARAEVQGAWAAEKAVAAAGEAAALAAAACAAEAPLAAALEEAGSELAGVRSALAAAEARCVALEGEAAGARAALGAREAALAGAAGEIEELERALEAETEENGGHVAALGALQGALAKAEAERAAWQARWKAVDDKRAALLEQNLCLKGAIRVFARVRPALEGEEAAMAERAAARSGKGGGGGGGGGGAGAPYSEPLFHFPSATADDASELVVVERPGKGVGGYGTAEEGRRTDFRSMHRVFPPSAEQREVFGEVEGLVQSGACGPRAGGGGVGQGSAARGDAGDSQ